MKKIITCLSAALLGLIPAAMAQSAVETSEQTLQDATVCGVGVSKAAMKRNADLMTVKLDFDLENFDLDGNRVVVFVPSIVNGDDSLQLNPIGLYSRGRWYNYLRNGEKPLGGPDETSIRYSKRPESVEYAQTVEYADWMNGAQLKLTRSDYGCCRQLIYEDSGLLGAGYREQVFTPQAIYMKPTRVEAVKMRSLSGRAFVDFPVNKTVIYPDYRNNQQELAKIIATIDSVRNDADVTVQSITIKGFASPEGSYENNIRLAKGRTEALKSYVRNLYRFDDGFISTDYEPEDWEGLRAFVETSGLTHRDEILAIIDSNLAPDPKNSKIQTTYPEEYRFLLQTVYPALRHSDYTIEYTIRNFTDVNDIAHILHTQPQKLSLSEMYLLAKTLEPGSDEYKEVFDIAVRMYPDDETANLNAANSAMSRNDLKSAEKYLAKAGASAEAEYARGKLAALQGDYAKARTYFESAAQTMPEAAETLKQLSAYQFEIFGTDGTEEASR